MAAEHDEPGALDMSMSRKSSSPEPVNSRKRPRDNDSQEENSKKSNSSPGHGGIYHLKILVPSVAAGAIIGKGGETIAQLQTETNARIKMSKANDFYPGRLSKSRNNIDNNANFLVVNEDHGVLPELLKISITVDDGSNSSQNVPLCEDSVLVKNSCNDATKSVCRDQTGTTERVCLISGNTSSIMDVLDFITYKIREKPELTSKSYLETDVTKGTERERQIKILVPNSTAGMIIGKGGNYIKKLKDESGAYVQISQKAKDQSLQERCITVIGDTESNKKACQLILAKIQEDPQSGSCMNVSYADISGPVANFSPTGSPFAQSSPAQQPATTSTIPWAGLPDNGGLAGITLTLNLEQNNVPSQAVLTQLVSAITVALNNTAYPEHIKAEITDAIATLGKYRMLGVSWAAPYLEPPAANGILGGRNALDLALEPFRNPLLNNNAFLVDPPDKSKEPRKVEVEIPEHIVGAVLGEGGRTLARLQDATGALIQISKKGVFVPGTRNRLATITGSTPAIVVAHSLIQQRLAEEEAKRSSHRH